LKESERINVDIHYQDQCFMINKLPYLTLAALALIAFTAKADDFAWGATTGSSIVKLDATTGQLQSLSYNGTPYTNFPLINAATLHNLTPLWIAQNPSGVLYGMDNSGNLYTIATTLSLDANNNIGLAATSIGAISSVSDVRGAVWISSNLLDISWGGTNLSQYNLTTKAIPVSLGAYSNSTFTPNIGGLAYNGSLYGVQFSPSPSWIDLISGVKATNLAGSMLSNGANGTAPAFFGASLLYVSDGNNNLYSYNFASGTLSGPTSYSSLSNVHSLTPVSVSGGSGTPTPTPTATPSATPTATPTPTPTATPKITYSVPTGSMTVTAPETTSSGFPECAPAYTYSVGESSLFAAGAAIDPNGTLGIYRYYQTATMTAGVLSYLPATATPAVPLSTIWAWPSGSTNTHAAISFTAGQVNNTTVALDLFYGREIFTLVYSSPGNGTTTVLDTKTIYLYPWNYNSAQTLSPTALFTNAVNSVQAASNPYPYATPTPAPLIFQGDLPRFTVQMNSLYPNGASSVIIYPGTPISNPTASGAATIAITAVTTPTGGLYTTAVPITFETLRALQTITASTMTPPTYTIAAIQTLPSVYATSTSNPAVLNTLTFTLTSSFGVNGTVGTVK
jgi:hypothetical protein